MALQSEINDNAHHRVFARTLAIDAIQVSLRLYDLGVLLQAVLRSRKKGCTFLQILVQACFRWKTGA